MERDSARFFGITVVITVAIVGGVYLLDRANRTGRPLPPEQATWTELTPSSRNDALAPSSQPSRSEGVGSSSTPDSPRHPGLDPGSIVENVSAETSAEGIIVCQHPEHGTVYTNAASCDEVDYDNRLSQAESFQPIPNPDRYKNNDYQSPQSAAANGLTNSSSPKQKPNLRLHGKSPPNGLNVSCKNSVGKALEIERDLAATDDPRESTWRDSYCKQRCEAIEERCPVADDYFYYRFRYICPNSDHYPCFAQN